MNISETILQNLILQERYIRDVLPHINEEYFEEEAERRLFILIKAFIDKFNKNPTIQVIKLELDNINIGQDSYDNIAQILDYKEEIVEYEWLLDATERWCKERSLFNALSESIQIADGNSKGISVGEIPDLLKNALNVSFDKSVGMDIIEDGFDRHDLYNNELYKVPFDIDQFNTETNGGIPKKTLNLVVGATNCVHPTTMIKVRVNQHVKDIEISEVDKLLSEGYEVEVTSPDGWVGVDEYIIKPDSKEYIINVNGKEVRSSEGHRYETDRGWVEVKDLLKDDKILTEEGLFGYMLKCTGKIIPIVDISVNHENQRYYTNGISSHNSGKSIGLVHLACMYMNQGKKVLFVSLEMSEEEISKRIDANLLELNIDDIKNVDKDVYLNKLDDIKKKTTGDIIVKEYPTSSAHTGHIRFLLSELKNKKDYVPEVIIVDYLNIMCSAKVKMGGSVNSYTYVKYISEELRGLAVETETLVWSASQLGRAGYRNSDTDLTDISESFGTAMTADTIWGLIRTDQLDEMDQWMFKTMKNRFGPVGNNFCVGIDYNIMKLKEIEQSEDSFYQPANVGMEESNEYANFQF